jgi:hypothetical protein
MAKHDAVLLVYRRPNQDHRAGKPKRIDILATDQEACPPADKDQSILLDNNRAVVLPKLPLVRAKDDADLERVFVRKFRGI